MELYLDRYLLPGSSSLGSSVQRWHRPVAVPTRVVRLRALVPSHTTSKGRLKLDVRGPPLHTVRQVAGRVTAVLAMPAAPTRVQSAVAAAADVCLLPYTFTNWTDAWDYSLMKVSVLLFKTLLPDKPAAAGSVLQACSDLLDLPAAFAPRGQLYQGLCTLQLHIWLVQVASELKAAGLAAAAAPAAVADGAAAAAPDPAAVAEAPTSSGLVSLCGDTRGAAGRVGRRTVAAAGRNAAAAGSRAGGGSSSRAACEARQRDAAMAALMQLLAKAAERVGVVLDQLSCYGSELSDLLDEYSLPAPDTVAAGPSAASGGGGAAAAGAADTGPAAAASGGVQLAFPPPAARDLRLQVAELLEPYAAMQLVDAFGRLMVGVGFPVDAPPPLLPLGTLPSGLGCHRSLFHAILELAVRAGVRLAPAAMGSDGPHGHGLGGGGWAAMHDDGAGPSHGSVVAPLGASCATLELPLVATMLDALLQLHVQAHVGCKGGGAAGAGGGGGGGGGAADDSDDSSSSSSSGSDDEGPRGCRRTPAMCQLPPCLDWLQDVISVLGALCDVYALAGGTDVETEAGMAAGAGVAEPQAPSADIAGAGGGGGPTATGAAGAAPSAAAAAAGAAVALPIHFMAAATGATAAAVVAAAGATAAAAPTTADPARPVEGPVEEGSIPALGPSTGVVEGQARGGIGATTAAAAASPEPVAPSTPAGGSEAEGGGGGSSSSGGSSVSLREGGVDPSKILPHQPWGSGGSTSPEHASPPKVAHSPGAGGAPDEDELAAPPPTTPPQAAVSKGGAAAAAAAPAGAAGPAPAAAVAAAAAAAVAPPALLSARSSVLDALLRAFQCPCLVEQALAGGARSGELCERAVWRHPRLAGCAPAAAYQKQLLDELLSPLSYVYEEDDYDAPVVVVDRSDLLGTSMSSLMDYQDMLHHEGICVSFEDEMAYGDGVLREWLTEVAAAVFDPNAGLFRLCEGDARCLHLSPAGCQQDDQLELLNFAGRVIGLAMRAHVPLGFHLSSALYKLLQHPGGAGRARLGLADLAQLEPRLAATCGQIAAATDVEVLGLTFVASCGQLGAAHEVPLLPGGRGGEEPVTAANRGDYLDRLVRFYCTWGCSSEHGELAESRMTSKGAGGGADVGAGGGADGGAAPAAGGGGEAGARRSGGGGGGGGGGGAADGCNWDECELDAVEALAQGLSESLFECEYDERVESLAARLRPINLSAFNARLGGEVGRIDVAAWRSHTSAPAFKSDRERAALEAFWEVVSELPAEEQRRLLQFWTGISHLPAGGFKHLSQQLQIVPARTGEEDGGGSGSGEGGPGAAAGGGPSSSGSAERATGAGGLLAAEWSSSDGGVAAAAGSDLGSSAASASDVGADERTGGGHRSCSDMSSAGSNNSNTTTTGMSRGGDADGSGGAGASSGGGGGGGTADPAAAVSSERSGAGAVEGGGQAAAGGGEGGGGGRAAAPPVLLAAHTCFFQLRLPVLAGKGAMRGAVVESLANLGAFWNE